MRYYDCYEGTICKKKKKGAENFAKLIVQIIFPRSFIIISFSLFFLLEIQSRNAIQLGFTISFLITVWKKIFQA